MKKFALIFAVVVALFLGYVAMQPKNYVIFRQTTINAPAEKIFPYLNDSRLGETWGPWKEVDPGAEMVHSGPPNGVGAKSSWDSKGQLGTGSATITESVPNQRVGITLEYTKPMGMKQYSEYILEPSGAGTVVIWKVSGENNFPGRIMCVFMNMDKMVGGMFEKGLSNLKALVEKN